MQDEILLGKTVVTVAVLPRSAAAAADLLVNIAFARVDNIDQRST